MINEDLLQYLCCPECKSNFREQDGFLICEKCGEKYEIRDGIPILVNLNSLPQHLQEQIKYFEEEDNCRPQYRLQEWQKSYIRRLDENFQLRNKEILIDVGTGFGYIAVETAKRGLKVIALDLTLKELIKLKDVIKKEHLEDNLFLVCCSAESLPFKNGIADYLVSNAVLEHLPREKEAISEISRVCKNKNRIMVTVPLKLKYILPFFIPLNYFYDKKIGHLRRYDEKILLNKFSKFRYRIKRVYYSGHFLKVFKLLFNNFIWKIFDLKEIEDQDRKLENKKCGASNICIIFER